MNKKIIKIMESNNLNFVIVIDISNKTYEKIGILQKEDMDLYNSCFYNENESILNITKFLEDKKLPSSFRQGKNTCTFFKPNENFILSIFYQHNYNFIDSLDFADKLNNEIDQIFNPT